LERLCDLYFELSNEDRLGILYRLKEGGMKITSLSREMGITTQECSRHMARLSEARLVEKDSDGLYGLTQYGRLSLVLISGQRFVAEHRDYFNAHTLERLPSEFACRIGEISGSELTPSVMVTFSLIESIFENAEDHVWVMHDRYLLNILPLSAEALRRGVRIRTLDTVPKEPSLDQARPTYISEADEELFIQAWHDGKIKVRKSDTIELFLYVSEREAVIAFPLVDGSFDYLGFHSGDQAMLSYCRDLFDFYYEKGVEPPRDLAEELHEKRLQHHREEKNT
jgi:predicted transcriptional regulator